MTSTTWNLRKEISQAASQSIGTLRYAKTISLLYTKSYLSRKRRHKQQKIPLLQQIQQSYFDPLSDRACTTQDNSPVDTPLDDKGFQACRKG